MCLQNVYERHQRARKKREGRFPRKKLTLIVYVYENEMTEKWVWKVQRYTYECNLFAADYAKPKLVGSLRPIIVGLFWIFLNENGSWQAGDKPANIPKIEAAKFFWACSKLFRHSSWLMRCWWDDEISNWFANCEGLIFSEMSNRFG